MNSLLTAWLFARARAIDGLGRLPTDREIATFLVTDRDCMELAGLADLTLAEALEKICAHPAPSALQ
jgi:hypothetical protein